MEPLSSKFFSAIEKYGMLAPGDKVLVGFSGGADSICLLSLLHENRRKLGINVIAAHVNHMLRGEESDRDEAFCRSFCEARGIPIFIHRQNVAALAQEKGISTELCAREVRYAFFGTLNADKIATAHTGSDCCETMLMNLGRGASAHGLCSIPPVRGNVIRPLIRCTRKDTVGYCAEKQLDYVTDSTNLQPDYTRNMIRLEVIPKFCRIFPEYEKAMLRCIEALHTDDDFLLTESNKYYDLAFRNDRLYLDKIIGLHPALLNRILFRFCTDAGSDVEEKHVTLLRVNMLRAGFVLQLPGGIPVESTGKELFVPVSRSSAQEYSIKIRKQDLADASFSNIRLRFCFSNLIDPFDFKLNTVDFYKIDDIIEIRSAKADDSIRLQKRNCSKTLKKFYTELKIPAAEWRSFPVIADSQGIIWAYAAGVHQNRAPNNNSKKLVIINAESDKQ